MIGMEIESVAEGVACCTRGNWWKIGDIDRPEDGCDSSSIWGSVICGAIRLLTRNFIFAKVTCFWGINLSTCF